MKAEASVAAGRLAKIEARLDRMAAALRDHLAERDEPRDSGGTDSENE